MTSYWVKASWASPAARASMLALEPPEEMAVTLVPVEALTHAYKSTLAGL